MFGRGEPDVTWHFYLQGERNMRFCDLTGNRYGRLTVIERVHKPGNNRTFWRCCCDCGNTTIVDARDLKNGHTKSCGCMRRSAQGFSNNRIYNIYKKMIERTTNPNCKAYKDYGGRNIKVCDEWLNDFEKFYLWSVNNGYDEGLTIDRIDNGGNYEPDNCRWVTPKVQANNRRSNHNITYNGQTRTMKQWAEILNVNYKTISGRINQYNWPIERALAQ